MKKRLKLKAEKDFLDCFGVSQEKGDAILALVRRLDEDKSITRRSDIIERLWNAEELEWDEERIIAVFVFGVEVGHQAERHVTVEMLKSLRDAMAEARAKSDGNDEKPEVLH